MKKLHLQTFFVAPMILTFSFADIKLPLLGQLLGGQSPTAPSHDESQEQKPRGKTPQELGKEYKVLVMQAKDAVSAMPKDMPVIFPLAVNYPVRMTDVPTDEQLGSKDKIEAIGFVNSEGKPTPFTTTDLIIIFEEQLKRLSRDRSSSAAKNQSISRSSTSEELLFAQKVPVLDLIILNPKTEETFLVKKVRFVGIFRDALNGTLNKEVKRNEYDVRKIDLREIRELKPR